MVRDKTLTKTAVRLAPFSIALLLVWLSAGNLKAAGPAASFPGIEPVLYPVDPVAGEPVWMRLTGYWPSGCLPGGPSVFRTDGVISIRFVVPNTPCPAVMRPIDYKVFLGTLSAGTYGVQLVTELDDASAPPQAFPLKSFEVRPASTGEDLPTAIVQVSPAAPSPRDAVSVTLGGIWPDSCIPTHGHVTREGSVIHVTVAASGQVCKDALTNWSLILPAGSFPEGLYTLSVEPQFPDSRTVKPVLFRFAVLDLVSATETSLQNGRYQVSCRWKSQFDSKIEGWLKGYALATTTAAFWYFDPDKTEVFVRLLTPADGTNNGKTWVAISSLTDIEFWVFVTDTKTGQSKEYHSPPGSGSLIIDTRSFAY